MDPIAFNEGFLKKEGIHEIFFCEYGNKSGLPVLIVHGGPGSRSNPSQIKGFDTKKYHFITFDQRGCGKSTPLGAIKENDTNWLVTDIERLRKTLGIEKWVVCGSSWGATLALVYAQKHPEKVLGLMLGSVFLARKFDIEWGFTSKTGIARFFPDLWEEREKTLMRLNANGDNYAKTLLTLLDNADKETISNIASIVINWEGNLMNAFSDIKISRPNDLSDEEIASAKIFLHFQTNNFFLADNQIISQISTISHIPSIFVHGRHDLLCPPESSHTLSKSFSNCQLVITPTSNHRLTAEGDLLKKIAYNRFLDELSLY